MVVRGIGKMLNGAIERFLIVILVKINFFILQRVEIALHGALSYGHPALLMLCVSSCASQKSVNAFDVYGLP